MNRLGGYGVKVALAMKPKLLPCLAMVMGGALLGCSTVNKHPVAGQTERGLVHTLPRFT